MGSNANNVLDGFFRNGRLDLGTVIPTLSPSMDIQVPSNLERLLFDLFRKDGERLVEAMIHLREEGSLTVMGGTDDLFVSRWYDDEDTMAAMREVYRSSGRIVDPHSAVGIAAARDTAPDGPVVCLATAHPAKFADAVERALDRPPPVPAVLEGIHDHPERITRIPRDLGAIHRLLRERSRFS